SLAARQCLLLSVVVLVFAVPIAWMAGPRLAAEVPARQVRGGRRSQHRGMALAGSGGLLTVVLATPARPAGSLILPLRQGAHLWRAWAEVERTGGDPLLYGVGSGAVAGALGMGLAFCAGRDNRLRRTCVGVCLVLFTLPSAVTAIGLAR